MAKNKTTETKISVSEFINSVVNEIQRKDSLRLIEIMKEISGHEPKLWGPSIIGFGSYHYKYASGHEGDSAFIGFSPRKNATSLYLTCDHTENKHLLDKLGKYKMAKACIYIKKLSDIDEQILRQLAQNTIAFLKKTYPQK